MQDLIFPPLMTGMAIEGRDSDPFDTAIVQATLGVDAGLIVYNLAVSYTHLRAHET